MVRGGGVEEAVWRRRCETRAWKGSEEASLISVVSPTAVSELGGGGTFLLQVWLRTIGGRCEMGVSHV